MSRGAEVLRSANRLLLVLVVATISLSLGECIAQPVPDGSMDPLYDNPCNRVVDVGLAAAGKDALRTRMLQVDGSYRKGIELARAGQPQAALLELLTYQRAIAGIVASTHHVYVDSLLHIAAVRADLRSFDEALADVAIAVRTREQCLGSDDPFTLEALSMRASLQGRIGRWPDALKTTNDILQRMRQRQAALPSGKDASPGERKRLLVAESNAAAVAYRNGRREQAKLGAEAIVQGVVALEATDLERYELANSSWYVLDRIAYFARDAEGQRRAIQGLEQSYQAMRSQVGKEHPRTLPLLANLGFAVADVSARDAVPILGDYVAMVEAQRLRAARPMDRQLVLEGRANTYQRFAFAAHEAGRTEEAFWGMEWSKARGLRDDLSIKLALADIALSEGDRASLVRSERRIAELESLLEVRQVDPAKRNDLTLALLEEKRVYERSFAAAEARTPGLRLAAQSRIQRPDNARQVLRPDEVYIAYLTLRVDGPAFEVLIAVLEPSGKLTLVGPVSVLGLEQSVASFVKIMSTSGGLQGVAQNGKDLWRIGDAFFFDDAAKNYPEAENVTSVDPLRSMLSDKLLPEVVRDIVLKYRRWVISPGGVLWSVPFEALNGGTGLVVDSQFVRYIHSWSMLTFLSERAKVRTNPTPTDLLAIGGAAYSDRVLPKGAPDVAFPMWHDLAFSAAELDNVAKTYALVDGQSLFRGAQATRQTVMALNASGALGRARQILLSTHGFLNLANPAQSAVVLGRPQNGTEADRYLSAHDIARLNLNADVVVVSSCDSGTGLIAAGEGVLGLPYAFFAAGTQSTVLTLWEVYDDASTARLVGEFMGALRRGVPADEALTLAKRSVRLASDESRWAPFSLVGR